MRKTKKKSISILEFKIYVPPILVGLWEVKELTTPLTDISIPELWNAHDGVIGVFLRASNNLQDKILKLNSEINIELGHHIEVQLQSSWLMRKCGVFWSQLADEIDTF